MQGAESQGKLSHQLGFPKPWVGNGAICGNTAVLQVKFLPAFESRSISS